MDLVSQNLLMTSGGKKDPTYIDDVFSTYLWAGNDESGRSISNGIKLSNNNIGNSVYLNGTNEYLSIPSSSDFAFGTGDFTWEGWFYINDDGSYLISFGADVGNIDYYTYGGATRRLRYYNSVASHQEDASTVLSLSTWYHIAAARSSNTTKLFLNGTEKLSFTDNKDYGAEALYLGATSVGGSRLTGNISNVRIVKGQALYTSSFTPSTQALTTTSQGATASNVKLLCCNKSTPTGATVTPGTITTYGTPQSQGFGPFTGNDGEGGLVWIKNRTTAHVNVLFDTERGANERLRSDSNLAQSNADTLQPLFTNSGFTVGGGNEVNGSGNDYASWTWRKQKGFFDIVTYTGNNTARTISHSLGSVPGCIMIKRTDSSGEWVVYHTGIGATKYLRLDSSIEAIDNDNYFNDTEPTASVFTIKQNARVNADGGTYVAYLFAGGESTAATARSVDFDGSSDYLSIADNSDFTLGSGDFTFEAWVKIDALNAAGAGWLTDWATAAGSLGWYFGTAATGGGSNRFIFGWSDTGSNINTIDSGYTVKADGQFHHYSITRSGTTLYFFVDGNLIKTNAGVTESFYNPSGDIAIGQNPDVGGSAWLLNGKISNLRLVKGTCLYTTSFRPPTEPLTSITNTVLLCCNNSSVTGSTITPSTITAVGSPTASTDSPFDDPEGYKFGEGGDQNIIKCGSYIGNSTANHEIEIGWEPQWWLVKNVTGAQNWQLLDSMRGWIVDGNDEYLVPNNNTAEGTFNFGNPTPTGFNMSNASSNWQNASGSTYVYIAIRRPDGYVGKPPEAGTDAFFQNTLAGADDPSIRSSNFAGDMGMIKTTAIANSWNLGTRLTQGRGLVSDTSASEVANSNWMFDYMNGANEYNNPSVAFISYLWKRGAGFDVVTYKGNGVAGHQIKHNLSVTPEMIWIKDRDSGSANWVVWHKGLNGGTNAFNYYILLNSTGAEIDDSGESTQKFHTSTPPTSTTVSLGSSGWTNSSSARNCLMMLFASVEGISKVGYYTGNGSTQSITTGFTPRFLILKPATQTYGWFVVDTIRGWPVSGSGDDDRVLQLQSAAAESQWNVASATSTGFDLPQDGGVNGNNEKYIYYAHA